MADDEAEGGGADAEASGASRGHSKRWWLGTVVVPVVIAVISSTTALITHPWSRSNSPSETSAAPSSSNLPPADPVPAAWCFECYPHLTLVSRECRDGSMSACDDLWKSIGDPKAVKEGDPAAIHDYGITCGGRRQLKAPGYRYKDCVNEFPGHN